MAVAGIGAAVALAGVAASVGGAFLQYQASEKMIAAQKQQANLEAQRMRLDQLRRGQAAGASATSNAYNQGAGYSSALAGGVATINSQANRNVLAVSQDQQLANQMFSASRMSAFGGMVGAIGGGIQSLGGAISNNAGTITRLGYQVGQTNLPFSRARYAGQQY